MVGKDPREQLYDPPSLLPVYWVQESPQNMVEEAFDDMGSWLAHSVFIDLLVHEVTSY